MNTSLQLKIVCYECEQTASTCYKLVKCSTDTCEFLMHEDNLCGYTCGFGGCLKQSCHVHMSECDICEYYICGECPRECLKCGQDTCANCEIVCETCEDSFCNECSKGEFICETCKGKIIDVGR